MGLALPGMNLGMSSNGHYGDVRVKDEPEEFRPRGGAVSHWSLLSAISSSKL